MDFADVLRARRTNRHFSEAPVAHEVIDRIISAGLRTPSAGHTQGTRLLVLESPAARTKFWTAISHPSWHAASPARDGLRNAACVVLPLENPAAYLERYSETDKAYAGIHTLADFPAPYWTLDAAFAAMAIQLAVVNEGLSYAFIGLPFGVENLREEFNIPNSCRPIGAIAFGQDSFRERSASAARRGKLGRETIIHYDSF